MFKLLQKMFSNKEKKENETMADEKDVKKEETKKVETEEKAKVDEKPTEKADEKVEETKKTEEEKKVDETKEEPNEPAEPVNDDEKQVVEEVEPAGNGVRVEDLVTKDDLAEKLAALEAKFDAVIKENGDLKNEVSRLQDKYEDKDFGGLSAQGVMQKDENANSTFDEYSKKFM